MPSLFLFLFLRHHDEELCKLSTLCQSSVPSPSLPLRVAIGTQPVIAETVELLVSVGTWRGNAERCSLVCVPDPQCIFELFLWKFRVKRNRSIPELTLTRLSKWIHA